MHPPPARPSVTDIAMEVGSLSAGLGIITMALFPFAVPLLLLVVAPLALVAVAGAVLAAPILLLLWVVRRVRRARSRPRGSLVPAGNELRAIAAGRSAATR